MVKYFKELFNTVQPVEIESVINQMDLCITDQMSDHLQRTFIEDEVLDAL